MTSDELRRRRLALALTQRQLADALGVRQSEISRWESGGRSRVRITRHRAAWLDQELARLERDRTC